MSWTITPTQLRVDDQDALTYLAAVETADGQALESGVRLAVNAFVKGCKADGIWPAIKASCILAGARTLEGALVPLVGAAPTNVNFVAGDYNRETGLVGDGSTKYLNSNRNCNADPQNSFHQAVYVTQPHSPATNFHVFIGEGQATTGASHLGQGALRNRSATSINFTSTNKDFISSSRNSSSTVDYRHGGVISSAAIASEAPTTLNQFVFCRNLSGSPSSLTNARLAFYSIGEALDLAKLDARVTALITAIAAAIP